MSHKLNLTGMRFGRLTVLRAAPNHGRLTTWHCACTCGSNITTQTASLRAGLTKSCGCLRKGPSGADLAQKIGALIRVCGNGCHEWTGGRDQAGYGIIMVNGRRYGVHRYIWEQIHGEPPKNFVIHHLCENPSCVNPEHLEAMDNAEHARMHGYARPLKKSRGNS